MNAEQAVDTLKLEDNDVLYEMLYGNGILQLEIVFAVNAALLDLQEEGNVFEDAEIDAKALVKDPNEEALNSTLMSGLRSQRLYQSIGIPRVVWKTFHGLSHHKWGERIQLVVRFIRGYAETWWQNSVMQEGPRDTWPKIRHLLGCQSMYLRGWTTVGKSKFRLLPNHRQF